MEKRTLLTIIAEASIENAIIQDIKRLGAMGYTLVEASGEGSRGVRSSDWDQGRNVRIEVICEEQVARRIVDHLTQTYYKNYAMAMYLTAVDVIRPDKF